LVTGLLFTCWVLGSFFWSIETNDPDVWKRRTRRGTRGDGRAVPHHPVGETNIHHRAINLTVGIRRTEDVVRDLTRRLFLDIKEEGYTDYSANPLPPVVVAPGTISDLEAGRIVRDALSRAWSAPEHIHYEDIMAQTYVERMTQDYVAQGGLPGHWKLGGWGLGFWLRERLGISHPPIQA
jgi:hypothetical protein